VSKTEMVNKVRAAAETRRDEDFVIIARTDAQTVTNLADAIECALAYCEAGADMIFVEALQTTEELEVLAEEHHPETELLRQVRGVGRSPRWRSC
jgi:2-methylisocitrate lyase-like PEP mutase family enzyme